jgi:hypothetical protein
MTRRIDAMTCRIDGMTRRIDGMTFRIDVMTRRIDVMTRRIDVMACRIDGMSRRIEVPATFDDRSTAHWLLRPPSFFPPRAQVVTLSLLNNPGRTAVPAAI